MEMPKFEESSKLIQTRLLRLLHRVKNTIYQQRGRRVSVVKANKESVFETIHDLMKTVTEGLEKGELITFQLGSTESTLV
jgi:hypothetical protein